MILIKRVAAGQARIDWGYDTEPQEQLGGRPLELPRGKVLGGSSSINAMVYLRGHRGDYDRWARNGARGWSYAEVLPYFKRTETWQGGENAYPKVAAASSSLHPIR